MQQELWGRNISEHDLKMDNYALHYKERSSRSFSLGTSHLAFKSTLRYPVAVNTPTPVIEQNQQKDGNKDNEAKGSSEGKGTESPPAPENSDQKSDPETKSPQRETPTGGNGSDEGP